MTKETVHGKEFVRGAKAAADIAANYNSSTLHSYRLDDCILAKLNMRTKQPRRNSKKIESPDNSWVQGYAVALAEVHRICHNTSSILEAAKGAGLTIKSLQEAGVSAFDWRELKRVGVPMGKKKEKG